MPYIDSRGVAIQPQTLGINPAASLVAQSATSATPTVLDALSTRTTAVMVVTSSAGVSAGAVTMQGSLDSVSWYTLGTAVSTTTASTTFTPATSTTVPFRYVRALITTTITGGTISATVGASG
jgi:hypothetical protein